MKAVLWIEEKKCRILVSDDEGRVIDTDDTWNNRASAEMAVMDGYGHDTNIEFAQKPERIKELNEEWKSCRSGN